MGKVSLEGWGQAWTQDQYGAREGRISSGDKASQEEGQSWGRGQPVRGGIFPGGSINPGKREGLVLEVG